MRDFHEIKRSATRYWERRRIYYNLALVLPALFGYSMGTTAAARHGLIRESGTEVVIVLFAAYAILANICYTFSYALEFLFGSESVESRWCRSGRTIALVGGTLFAMLLATFGGSDVGRTVYSHKLKKPPNQAASVNAPIALDLRVEHPWRRVTEPRRSTL